MFDQNSEGFSSVNQRKKDAKTIPTRCKKVNKERQETAERVRQEMVGVEGRKFGLLQLIRSY